MTSQAGLRVNGFWNASSGMAKETGGALGAARLAWLAAGGDLQTVCVSPPVCNRFDSDEHLADMLAAHYGRFRRLYPALRAQFEG